MCLFGNSRKLKSGTNKLLQKPWASPKNKGEEYCFIKQEEVGRGGVKGKSAGEKQEFR